MEFLPGGVCLQSGGGTVQVADKLQILWCFPLNSFVFLMSQKSKFSAKLRPGAPVLLSLINVSNQNLLYSPAVPIKI